MKIRPRTLILWLLAIAAISFCLGVAYGFQTPPKEKKEPAWVWYVEDLQGQIDEVRRATWSEARIERRISELEKRMGELEREVNEINVELWALGRDR
jgi:hypothetical protein